MRVNPRIRNRWLVIVTLLSSTFAYSQTEYEVTRSTIGGGGIMLATSGDGRYELSGTIGQADATCPTTGPMGSGYELTGGYWFALAPGDCNSDAAVDLQDYQDFTACITGPEGGQASLACRCFDLDADNDVDLRDTALLQLAFTG